MLQLVLVSLVLLINEPLVMFNFDKDASLRYWRVVDDGVMGGRSNGQFGITEDGYGIFSGTVSLENNGGFSSVRYAAGSIDVSDKQAMVIRLKGDGKDYQLRIKRSRYDYHSYVKIVSTSGDWQTITIPLNEMYPRFRGYRVDLPNFEANTVEEFAILIGNKKAESFKLLIDSIRFE